MPHQGFKNTLESYGFLLHDVARLLRRNLNRQVQKLGLTEAQWKALIHISRHEGINQIGLAELLEVQPISVARLIDRMQSAGWVERRPDPKDRRAVRLYLTEKANPILDDMWALAVEVRAEATRGISDTEKDQLLNILLRMRANLTETGGQLS